MIASHLRRASFGALATVLLAAPAPTAAQVLAGRVLDGVTGRPVPAVAVSLVSRGDESRDQTLSDEQGQFVLQASSEGEYYLRADALGYEPTVSPLLAIPDSGTFTIDLELRPEPLGLSPIVVTADRYEKWVRLFTGLNPRSVMGEVIAGDELRLLAVPGRDLTDVLRWANLPGATVQRGPLGMCVSAGRVQCLPVYVDGMAWPREEANALDPDEIEAIVYMRSMDGSTLFTHGGLFNQNDPRSGGRIMIFRVGFLSR